MKDYGKLLYDLLPNVTVSGKVYPSKSFGKSGWLIRRGFFYRNAFVYSTAEFDQKIASAAARGRKTTVIGKIITRSQDNRTLMLLPIAVS